MVYENSLVDSLQGGNTPHSFMKGNDACIPIIHGKSGMIKMENIKSELINQLRRPVGGAERRARDHNPASPCEGTYVFEVVETDGAQRFFSVFDDEVKFQAQDLPCFVIMNPAALMFQ